MSVKWEIMKEYYCIIETEKLFEENENGNEDEWHDVLFDQVIYSRYIKTHNICRNRFI